MILKKKSPLSCPEIGLHKSVKNEKVFKDINNKMAK